MYISQIYSIILLSFGAAALYLGLSAVRKQFREYAGNAILGLLCFSSSIWCYGFGLVFLTTNTTIAYWGRTLGMIGVFAYLILAQVLVGILVKIPKIAYICFCSLAALGVFIYFPVVSPSNTLYYMGEWGMTYTFMPGIVNNIYTTYSVIFAINMTVSIYYMIKCAENRRSRVTGYKMGVTLFIVFCGMILDTILPMFGFGAIPGSSISQFMGLLVIYYAIVDFNKTRITTMNMSQYIYESVLEPVMVFTPEGKLRLTNKAADEIFIETFENTKNGADIDITDIFSLEEDYLSYDGKHRTDDTRSVIGNIPLQIETSRIEDRFGDTIGFILTIKDMTNINEIMNSLKEAKQLAETNNLAKSAFLANMSHEIRTPLNAIVGFSELLVKSDIPSKEKEQVEDIRSSSYNLLAIINDVLDISKIESGKMELNETEYKVSDVIRDAYLITEASANKKGIDFSMEIEEAMPDKLYGDPVRIRGILVNVLSNAVKYTPKGSVKLTGDVISSDGEIAVLQFKVIDTGIGIKIEDKNKLFETFRRVDSTKNAGIEGTGLGLAIVRGFLDLMGGDVEVESEYGKGSIFTVTFPQKIIENNPVGRISIKSNTKATESAIGKDKFSGVKVLAVDDNKVNLKVISKVLKEYEMDVTTADSGIDAIEICTSEEFDVILMDQMMPVMDGIEAMKKIRALGSQYSSERCKIIALTANAITGVREELLSEGFDEYLSKPINFPKMEQMFKEILSK